MIVGLASVSSGCRKVMNYESRSSGSIECVCLAGGQSPPDRFELICEIAPSVSI